MVFLSFRLTPSIHIIFHKNFIFIFFYMVTSLIWSSSIIFSSDKCFIFENQNLQILCYLIVTQHKVKFKIILPEKDYSLKMSSFFCYQVSNLDYKVFSAKSLLKFEVMFVPELFIWMVRFGPEKFQICSVFKSF